MGPPSPCEAERFVVHKERCLRLAVHLPVDFGREARVPKLLDLVGGRVIVSNPVPSAVHWHCPYNLCRGYYRAGRKKTSGGTEVRARTPTRTSQTQFLPARSVGPYTLSFSLSTPDTFSEKSYLRVTIHLPTWHQRSGTHHQLSESLNIEMQPAMWEDNEMRRNPRVYTKEIETKSKLPHTPRRKIESFKLKRTATEQQVSETPEAF